MSPIVVVSVAIVDMSLTPKRICLAQRANNTSHALKWCTPGGKAEKSETRMETARRELREELGVKLTHNADGFGELVYTHPMDNNIVVYCYRVDHYHIKGPYSCRDKTIGVGWYTAPELGFKDLAPADRANIKSLSRLIL